MSGTGDGIDHVGETLSDKASVIGHERHSGIGGDRRRLHRGPDLEHEEELAWVASGLTVTFLSPLGRLVTVPEDVGKMERPPSVPCVEKTALVHLPWRPGVTGTWNALVCLLNGRVGDRFPPQ